MNELLQLLLFHTWWSSAAGALDAQSLVYRGFNLVEAVTFASLGCHVLSRAVATGRLSSGELQYGVGLLLLGMTDVREMFLLESWLVWTKLLLVAWILTRRAQVVRAYFPGRLI